MILKSNTGERGKHIKPCQHMCIELNGGDILRHSRHKIGENACLYYGDTILGAEYLLLVLLQLLRLYIAQH